MKGVTIFCTSDVSATDTRATFDTLLTLAKNWHLIHFQSIRVVSEC